MENYRRFPSCRRRIRNCARSVATARRSHLDAGESSAWKRRSGVDLQAGKPFKLYSDTAAGLSRLRAPKRPGALSVARAYETTGQPGRHSDAGSHRAALSGSPQLDEVQFRRGELLFSAKTVYAEASGPTRSSSSVAELPRSTSSCTSTAGPVQTVASRGEPALVRGRAGSEARRRNGKVPRLEDLKRATVSWPKTRSRNEHHVLVRDGALRSTQFMAKTR